MRISDWSSDVCSSDLPSGAFGVHSVPGTTPYPGASGDANDLVWETPPAGRQAVLWTDDARDLRTAFCGSYGRWFDFRCRVPAALFPAYSRRVHSPISLNEEGRSEEHTSELQSLMRISYAVFCLTKHNINQQQTHNITIKQIKTNTKTIM